MGIRNCGCKNHGYKRFHFKWMIIHLNDLLPYAVVFTFFYFGIKFMYSNFVPIATIDPKIPIKTIGNMLVRTLFMI